MFGVKISNEPPEDHVNGRSEQSRSHEQKERLHDKGG